MYFDKKEFDSWIAWLIADIRKHSNSLLGLILIPMLFILFPMMCILGLLASTKLSRNENNDLLDN